MESLKPGLIDYPDSDGQPMADNTKQYRWIVTIKENIDRLLPDFVAGDLLWYPIQGDNKTRIAPDVLIALGRPKGDRGSYRTWEEGNIAPQIVFEVLSPKNTLKEMERKRSFYERHGVLEFYIYDPDHDLLEGWVRRGLHHPLASVDVRGWVSPRLGIRFDTSGQELVIYQPNGQRFLTVAELWDAHDHERTQRQHAEARQQRAEARQQRAEARQQRAERRTARLLKQLRALGIEPELEE